MRSDWRWSPKVFGAAVAGVVGIGVAWRFLSGEQAAAITAAVGLVLAAMQDPGCQAVMASDGDQGDAE